MDHRRLAALSTGGLPAKPGEIDELVEAITNASNPLYDRGLAAASLAACLGDRAAPGILQDLALMDSLIDIIGRTKGGDRGLSDGDVFKIRSNCCVLLSIIMGSVSGSDGASKDSGNGVIPMAALPEALKPPEEKDTRGSVQNRGGTRRGKRRLQNAEDEPPKVTSELALISSPQRAKVLLSPVRAPPPVFAESGSNPTGLYHMGAMGIAPQTGDPLPRTSKNGGAELGYFMTTQGEYRTHYARREGRGPAHRVGVLFGNELRHDAKVPLANPTDVFEVDRRLGYQIPRMWFPTARPRSAASKLDAPAERPSPLDRALRPHTSSLIRNEYFKLESHSRYLDMSERDPNHPLTLGDGRPRLGAPGAPEEAGDLWAQWRPGPGMAREAAGKDPSPKKAHKKRKVTDGGKTETAVPLAGYAYQYAMTGRRRSAWTEEPDAAAEAKLPRRARGARRSETVDDEVLPPPPAGSMVMREDLLAVKTAQATTKAAAKAVAESRAEAKIHNREKRLHAIIRAPVSEAPDALRATGVKEHESYMTVFESELKSVLAHKNAIQQEMVSMMEVHHQAMPLRFLFTIPGGAAYCRTRLRRAFAHWIAEFEKNQCVVALALWRMLVDRCRFREATEMYHKSAGGSKLSAIMHKMQLALKARVLRRLRGKVSWVIFEHRDKSALVIQRMVRRVRGLRRFLWMHDSQPIGGLLADIDMDECRFLSNQVVPRVRDDKRTFWRTAIKLQTQWRVVTHVRWWRVLRWTAIKLQALIRSVPVRRCFLRMRKASVVIEALVRMALKRWPFLRWIVKARVLQRIVRGHAARVIAYRRLLLVRSLAKPGLAMPVRIQCLWRVFLAKQCAAALRQHEKAEFLSALRIQYSWYLRQGNLSTFVLLGCLREQDQNERDRRRLVTRMFRRRKAMVIQSEWRLHRRARRVGAALTIQCAWRMFVNFVKVQKMRRRRWAARKLHFWAKGSMRQRHRAARKIIFWWWQSKPGRFLRHLTMILVRLEGIELEGGRQARDVAAAKIQGVVHGIWIRREIRRLFASLKIQRVARGFVGRRRAVAALRHVQRHVSSLFVERLQREAILKEQARRRRIQMRAATTIQALGRRFVVTVAFRRARVAAREQVTVAMMLQNNYRGHRRTAVAVKDLIAQRRRFLNPFKELTQASAILGKALARARQVYDGRDEYAGLGLSTVLRRLGLLDVLPVLRNAGVTAVSQLAAMDEAALEAAGVVESVYDKGRPDTLILKASAARALMVAFCRVSLLGPQARAALDESCGDAGLVRDFEVIPAAHRFTIAQKMFEEAYTARFASRSAHFAESVASAEVTVHQLRRFFLLHDTPAKAKEHLADLSHFEGQAEEIARDDKRLLACCDAMRYGVERLRDVLVGEGAVMSAVEEVYDLAVRANAFTVLKAIDERRRRRIEANGTKSCLLGPQFDVSHPMVRCVAAMEARIVRLVEMDAAAFFLQNTWRGSAGRQLLALALHTVAASRIARAYLSDRVTNQVRLVWEEDRRLEQEDYEKSYKVWLEQQQKDEAEAYLATITRFGWEEVFRKPDDSDDEGGGGYVFRRVGDEAFDTATSERPTYTVAESGAAGILQRFLRAMAARLYVSGLKRERLKVAKEAQEHVAWEKTKKGREMHVAVRFSLVVLDQSQEAAEVEAAAADDAAHAAKCADQVAALVDGDAELVVGFPVEARYGGGEAYFPGTVYQVNPTQYTTAEGIKWYPKGTFGVMYDDGDFEPAVPEHLIRVIKLRVESRVDARYGGHPAYFRGTVIGENTRNHKVLSYQVKYEDGEVEKAVPRNRIRVDGEDMALFQAKWAKLQTKNRIDLARRSARAKAKKAALLSRSHRVQALLSQFDEAWGANDRVARVAPQVKRGKAKEPKPSAALDVLAMIRASRQVFHETRPAVRVHIKIDYTRLAMRFGWQELATEDGKAYFLNVITQETSWIRPTFDFKEEAAACLLQSMFRAMMGKQAFRKRIESESLLDVVASFVREASATAWVGHGEEGVTLDLWLNRMGLAHLLPLVTKAAHKRAQRTNKPMPSNNDVLAALRTASLDDLKEHFDVEKAAERRSIIALRDYSNPAAVEQLAFVNSFESTGDPRTRRECISQSREILHKHLTEAFKGNPTRVDKMADALVVSRFPVTRAQLKAFLGEYDGKPAMAQDHITDLVDVPTLPTDDKEAACYEVLRAGARRLVVIASNLNVLPLKAEIELVMYRAQQVAMGGGDPGKHVSAGAVALSQLSKAVGKVSGHSGKAALLLRVGALEAAKRWWHATEKLQTVYRGHVALKAWKRFLAARDGACLMIQRVYRGHQMRELATYHRRQQRSQWEELWSEAESVFYYFHKTTGEAQWSPPAVPFRPMIRDRFTQRLMQAWPGLDLPDETAAAEPGMCMRCRVQEATRICDQCVPRKPPAWAANKKHLCFACFTEEHAASADLRKHTFTVTKLSKAEPLACCICAAMATRRCMGPIVTPKVFAEIDTFMREPPHAKVKPAAKHGHELEVASDVPGVKAFRDFVAAHKLPFSIERCTVLHQECAGGPEANRSHAEFWRAFLKVLEGMKEECNDSYCSKCWQETHRRGRRARHEWVGFKEAALVCAMCEKNVAERHCEVCVDDLCTACAVATHLRGKKHRHTMVSIREPIDKRQKYCGVCDVRAGVMECPLCDAPHCASCLEFRHAECPKKDMVGDPDKPTKCIVCGRPPDTVCLECGDVFCSAKWMGNPGCFPKLHRKGNRKKHTVGKYTYMEDKAAAQDRARKARKAENRELRALQAKAAAVEKTRRDEMKRRQDEREARILSEAQRLIAEKKKSKSFFKLPVIKSSKGILAPIMAAFGGGKSGGGDDDGKTAAARAAPGSPPSSPKP